VTVWLTIAIVVGTIVNWAIATMYVCVAAMSQFSEAIAANLPKDLAAIPTYRSCPDERDRNRSRVALFQVSVLKGDSSQLQLTSEDVNSLLVLSQKLSAIVPLHYAIEGDRLVELTGSIIPTLFGPSGYFKQVSASRFALENGELVEILQLERTRFSMQGEVLDRQSLSQQKPIASSTILKRVFSAAVKLGEQHQIGRVLGQLKQVDIRDNRLILSA
jgi:hypothetical protein